MCLLATWWRMRSSPSSKMSLEVVFGYLTGGKSQGEEAGSLSHAPQGFFFKGELCEGCYLVACPPNTGKRQQPRGVSDPVAVAGDTDSFGDCAPVVPPLLPPPPGAPGARAQPVGAWDLIPLRLMAEEMCFGFTESKRSELCSILQWIFLTCYLFGTVALFQPVNNLLFCFLDILLTGRQRKNCFPVL